MNKYDHDAKEHKGKGVTVPQTAQANRDSDP